MALRFGLPLLSALGAARSWHQFIAAISEVIQTRWAVVWFLKPFTGTRLMDAAQP